MFYEMIDMNYEIEKNIINLATLKVFHDMNLPIKDLAKYHIEPLSSYNYGYSSDSDSLQILRVILKTMFSEANLFQSSTFIDDEERFNNDIEKDKELSARILSNFPQVSASEINKLLTNCDMDVLLLEDDFTKIDFRKIHTNVHNQLYGLSTYSHGVILNLDKQEITSDDGMTLYYEISSDKKKILLHYDVGFFSYSIIVVPLFLYYLLKQMNEKDEN